MMDTDELLYELQGKICRSFDVVERGEGRYVIRSPFHFDDGDAYVVALEETSKGWRLSDYGHTFMYLSYTLSEAQWSRGKRGEIVRRTLKQHGIENRGGELVMPDVSYENVGERAIGFFHAISKITDIKYLTRKRQKKTFGEEFKTYIRKNVPRDRVDFDWVYAKKDTQAKYPVDARIRDKSRPLFVYALSTTSRTKDAALAEHMFRDWDVQHQAVGVLEPDAKVTQKSLDNLKDAGTELFTGLDADDNGLAAYIREWLPPGGDGAMPRE